VWYGDSIEDWLVLVTNLVFGVIGFIIGLEYQHRRELRWEKKKRRKDFKENIRTKLNEFVIIWNQYSNNIIVDVDPDFENKIEEISDTIFKIGTNVPSNVDNSILNEIKSLSSKIKVVSNHFHGVGDNKKSFDELMNDAGDEAKQLLEKIEKL
jgi:hypothetical protein